MGFNKEKEALEEENTPVSVSRVETLGFGVSGVVPWVLGFGFWGFAI